MRTVMNHQGRRIIPADAGSTLPFRRRSAWCRDHPRGCGEHFDGDGTHVRVRDHPRGCGEQRLLESAWRSLCRIIPADAGSTTSFWIRRALSRDHPRGCGEHPFPAPDMITSMGSSPRMRGAPTRRLEKYVPVRIIPADAGSTGLRPGEGLASEDHPRGCGEHEVFTRWIEDEQGSSPRMRGAPCDDFQTAWFEGIIPADAGSTALGVAGAVLDTGSSPRMRGARSGSVGMVPLVRIIPADAGSTASVWGSSRGRPDHPCGCGEHAGAPPSVAGLAGSSLRMRGAR